MQQQQLLKSVTPFSMLLKVSSKIRFYLKKKILIHFFTRYGWFWECPQGDKCKYRHALPEGYVLKRDLKKLKEAADDTKISLEDLIERERAALGVGTKITLESFNIWKKKKRAEKVKKSEKETKKKKGKAKAGQTGGLTGNVQAHLNTHYTRLV